MLHIVIWYFIIHADSLSIYLYSDAGKRRSISYPCEIALLKDISRPYSKFRLWYIGSETRPDMIPVEKCGIHFELENSVIRANSLFIEKGSDKSDFVSPPSQ